jgi:uncharacterized membrane protein
MKSLSLRLFRALNLRPAQKEGSALGPFFFRTEFDRLLASSMFFGCVMVLLRVLHTGDDRFVSMIWNLFLGYIPYVLSNLLSFRVSWKPLRFLLFAAWLLFIPNSFYMLTDLFHLADAHRNEKVPQWFDLVLILSFAWNGLLLGVLSVRQVERLFVPAPSGFRGWLFVYPIMGLNALGVYIGRYLRYNSWDIITNPVDLLSDIFNMIAHPLRYHDAWDMILCYSILLTLIYRMLKKLVVPLT